MKIQIVKKFQGSTMPCELWQVGNKYFNAYLYSDGVVQIKESNAEGKAFGHILFGHNTDDYKIAQEKVLEFCRNEFSDMIQSSNVNEEFETAFANYINCAMPDGNYTQQLYLMNAFKAGWEAAKKDK